MYFQRIFTPGLAINTYLLGDEKTKRCVVIDPTRRVVPIIMQAQNVGLDITDILETHVHADFASGSKELKHQLNKKPKIYASGTGGEKWVPHYADIVVQQGAQIKIGNLRLEAISTPGHTPEHLIWICYDESRSQTVPWFAFTGDCLFVGSIGRPDLLGPKELPLLASQLYHTLFDKMAFLPDFLEIFPSHGEGSLCGKSLKSRSTSTLGFERLFNPYLKKKSEHLWVEQMEKEQSPIPPYFLHLKKMNVEGPPLLNSLKAEIWDSTKDVPPLSDLFLMDVRHPESFAVSHLKSSINIPFSNAFCQWVGWMLSCDQPIGLVVESTYVYSEVVEQLRLMGFDQDIWIIQLGEKNQNFSCSFSSLPVMEVEELAKKQSLGSPLYVVDVRSPEEWRSGHIPGSHHIELNLLPGALSELPIDQSIALMCRSGQRASTAASLLQKSGFKSVTNVRGGMQAWKELGLPIKMGET